MRNKLIILGIFAVVSCKAQQQILPLSTSLDDIPPDSYVKDLNHELDLYIGNYKSSFQGKEITLYITKKEKKIEKSTKKNYYLDALIIKFIVRNSSGIILQDTANMPLDQLYHSISSYKIRSYDNSVILGYNGTNCGVGWGSIYLKKISNNQISWEYRPNDTIITPEKCPGNPDLTIYLPVTKDLIFTKQ